MQLLLIPIAIAAGVVTYAASYHVLKMFIALRAPRLIACVVALLSSLSLLSLGGGVITLIVIPYAALGLSLLLLPLLKWLNRCRPFRDLEDPVPDQALEAPRRRPPVTQEPGSTRARKTTRIRETPPTKE